MRANLLIVSLLFSFASGTIDINSMFADTGEEDVDPLANYVEEDCSTEIAITNGGCIVEEEEDDGIDYSAFEAPAETSHLSTDGIDLLSLFDEAGDGEEDDDDEEIDMSEAEILDVAPDADEDSVDFDAITVEDSAVADAVNLFEMAEIEVTEEEGDDPFDSILQDSGISDEIEEATDIVDDSTTTTPTDSEIAQNETSNTNTTDTTNNSTETASNSTTSNSTATDDYDYYEYLPYTPSEVDEMLEKWANVLTYIMFILLLCCTGCCLCTVCYCKKFMTKQKEIIYEGANIDDIDEFNFGGKASKMTTV